jgi:hypothetical protein
VPRPTNAPTRPAVGFYAERAPRKTGETLRDACPTLCEQRMRLQMKRRKFLLDQPELAAVAPAKPGAN